MTGFKSFIGFSFILDPYPGLPPEGKECNISPLGENERGSG
jgi:hypothetical protein